jgi:hypothetical protein
MEVDHVDPVAQTVVRAKLRQKPVRVPSAARVAGAHTTDRSISANSDDFDVKCR